MNERFSRAGVIARVDLAHEPDFALGPIRVRPARREISSEAWRETLEPRVMQVLVALERANGDILSRDDLIESCWDGVIVGEDAINRCIGRLRKVAEASGNAFSIETVPRVGYRLKPAETAAAAAPEGEGVAGEALLAPQAGHRVPDSAATPLSRAPIGASGSARGKPVAAIAAAVVLALAAAGLGVWRFWPVSAVVPSAQLAPAASVAVLPFVNMSGDPAKEYFSDGFSEELINDLAKDPHLRVAARTSSFAFKGRNEDVEAIARALRVRSIVEGSAREAGDRVRITAQLINAGSGYHIWSETYDRNLADILTVQDEIAREIATALTHKLAPAAPLRKIDPAVYRLYLLGRQQLAQFSPDGTLRALALFREVTTRQSDFADGFAALADTIMASHVVSDPAHVASELVAAHDAAQRALSLDPHNIEAREIRARLELKEWNWSAAAADLRALLAAYPNNPLVLSGLRQFYTYMDFPDQELTVWRRAVSLDFVSDRDRYILAFELIRNHRPQEAIGVANAILAHQPNALWALTQLCQAYVAAGRMAEAREVAARVRRSKLDWPLRSDLQQCEFEIDLAAGDRGAANNDQKGFEAEFPDRFPYPVDIADNYVLLGDFDKASDWYERTYELRDPEFFSSIYAPAGAKYRTTARWKALSRQPLFHEWQAEHDRIAADLAAHRPAP
jgi:TolB-like protein/DNA-binding winged helix-turn-helix (wHTH) protein/thioredoxin-like negative regulator of GroEL